MEYPVFFCEVKNHTILDGAHRINNKIKISPEDIFLFIKELPYNEETYVSDCSRPMSSSVASAVGAVMESHYYTGFTMPSCHDWEKIYRIWNKKQEIHGGVFLAPNGKQIWISHIDLGYFKLVVEEQSS